MLVEEVPGLVVQVHVVMIIHKLIAHVILLIEVSLQCTTMTVNDRKLSG